MARKAPAGSRKKQKKSTKAENEGSADGTLALDQVRSKIGLHLHLIEYELFIVQYTIEMLRKAVMRARKVTWGERNNKKSVEALNDSRMKVLSRQFVKQRFLKSLNLIVDKKNTTDEGFKYLSEGFRCLSSLKDLSLSFDLNSEQLEVLSDGFRFLSSLQNVTLHFDGSNRIARGTLNSMLKNFRYIPSLQSLILKLSFYTAKEKIRDLSEGLRYVSSLTSFTLELSYPYQLLLDEELKNLFEGFRFIPSLKSLTLSFGSQISPDAFKYLSESFRYISALQRLTLSFGGKPVVIDERLKYLSKGFQNISSLQSLTLNFQHSQDITDAGLRDFGEGCKLLSNLTRLYLGIKGCSQVSTNAITTLRKTLKLLKTFKTASINF